MTLAKLREPLLYLACLLLGMATMHGCAGLAPPESDQERVVQCVVCAFYRDLGCVDLVPDEHTPRMDYQGVTYFFCSSGCLKDFRERPGKFLKRNQDANATP